MQFRAEFFPTPFSSKIKHSDKLLLLGSCFTEQMGKKLADYKFEVLENPNGILFNPISIAKAVISYAQEKIFTEQDLFCYNELWASREHHTRFSHPDKEIVLEKISRSQQSAISFIKEDDWLLITLGSAFVYEWKDGEDTGNYEKVAANCHKIPTDKFSRRLLDPAEIVAIMKNMKEELIKVNPSIKIIFTVSPVRHLREGFIENNRSKAALIQAVHALTNNSDIFYFPAYELVIDDLRDYRFFAEDMVHPNYAATNYVWNKFADAVIDESDQLLMKEINEINAAVSHKAFNPTSAAHQKFLETNLKKIKILLHKFPRLNFQAEIDYLSSGLR